MKKIYFFLLLAPFSLRAQVDTGMHFEHDLSWSAIQAKAKAENKYIFMDCFTTWCGPCRMMATQVFPLEATGKYVNDKFISVGVQLDTTAKDADNIKAWYRDGHDIAEKYHVRAYPTYLIFAPDGHAIHRFVGSSPAPVFLASLAESFDSTRQYYTLVDEFNKGRRDSAFLHKTAMATANAYDLVNGESIANAWLATQSDLLTRDALYMQELFTKRSSDKYFSTFTDHAAEVNKVLGPGFAEAKVRNIFLVEATADRKPGDNRPPDWAAIHNKIASRLPGEADELTARVEISYFLSKKDFPNFERAMVTYMKTYNDKISDGELNNIAWSVFQNCSDMSCVSDILDWSKRLKDNSEAGYVDTYANILYKLGKKDDAIALETKAMSLAGDSDKASFQETINKMKNGEKTW
jgi:thiol-disulfide isomerase/thioredoxin